MSHSKIRRVIIIVLVGLAAALFLTVFVALSPADRSVLLKKPHKFDYDGVKRSYRLYVPKEVTPQTKVIVGLHGFSGSARRFAYYTGLHNVAKDSIVVYPDALTPNKNGLKTGWNAGFCCGSGWVNKADDVGFIVGLVDFLQDTYKIDSTEAFVAGFSNGSFMAQRLAAEHPGIFTAVASSSGSAGIKSSAVSPKGSIAILLMHGAQDKTVPLAGGVSGGDPDFEWLSFDETKNIWEQAGSRIEEKIYQSNGHIWNDWRIFRPWHTNPEASQRAVSFFDSV